MSSVALIGGGPAALFMYKNLVANGDQDLEIFIFEKNEKLGQGFPYGEYGSSTEHITNVSDNEIPTIVTHVKDWLDVAPKELLQQFDMEDIVLNEYKVLPRLLFGAYLSAQFDQLYKQAQQKKIKTSIHYNTIVKDLRDEGVEKGVTIYTSTDETFRCDKVIICTGHSFPKKLEGKIKGWYDSPYPPQKLCKNTNYPVAIAGASLTAIDAVRTLARANGSFSKKADGTYSYQLNEDSKDFKIVLHSLGGFLPALRFHLQDTHLTPVPLLTEAEVLEIKKTHDGFVPLDLIFQRHFMEVMREKDPAAFEKIKDKSLEEVIQYYLDIRERLDAFVLLKAEYAEAEKSIERHQSVMWKETLGALSYALNYPAKHFSAEDMLRLKKSLMPLISLVIAYVPQGSCRELMALYDAGVASLIEVDRSSHVEPGAEEGAVYFYTNEAGEAIQTTYKMYINAIGQPPVSYNDFPFETLRNEKIVSAAYLYFKDDEAGKKELETGNTQVKKTESGKYNLQVPGVQVNDAFQVLDRFGVANDRIYIMAVPLIAGINPDYSGLDFCEVAAERIGKSLGEEDKS